MSEIDNSVFTENTEVYLGVTVGSDPEMTPRQPIANVGYAINAETLQGLPPDDGSIAVPFIPYINSAGDMMLALANPAIRSTYESANFEISSANIVTIASAGTGDIVLQATESGTIKFRTQGATDTETRMIIDNLGNVGIGTTNPNYKLEVNGSLYATSMATGSITSTGDIIGERFLDYTNNTFGLDPAGTDMGGYSLRTLAGAILAQTTGNVGIGTTNPTAKLYILSSGAVTSSNYANIINNSTTNTTTNGINKYGVYITSTGDFTGSTGTETNNWGLYVDTVSGADNNYGAYIANNVGIGTSTPAQLLDIYQEIQDSDAVIKLSIAGGTGADTYIHFRDNGENKDWSLGVSDSNDLFRITTSNLITTQQVFVIDRTGNVGLGGIINPSYTLDINGTLRATNTVNFSGLTTSTTDQTAIMINSSNNLVKRTLGDLAFDNDLSFLDLTDTPSSYTGSAGYFVKVNSGETGLEFATASSISPWTETSGNVYLYTTSNKVSIGDTTAVHKLEVEGAITGKALVSLWEKGDQDILVASNGASTASNIFRLTNNGSIITSGNITTSSGIITGNILTDQTTTFSDSNWTSTSAISWDLANSTTALNIESGLLNFDTTNNYVGIGTASPAGKLHILSSATQFSRIAITDTLSPTPIQLINFRYNTNTNLGNIMGVDLGGNSTFYIQATASRYLGLGTNAATTPQVIIDTSGNVGIGTTAPATHLHISGSSGITVGLDASTGTNNTAGKIDLISAGDNAYSTTFVTGTQTADITYTLPTSINANGYLKTDATGILSWTTNITANSLYWDDLLDPTDNLTLNHSTYTTTFNTSASTQNFFTINANSLTSGRSLYLSSTSSGLSGSILEINHSPTTSGGTGNLLKLATNSNSSAVPLMITNLGSGFSFRVNDETGDSDTTPFVIDASGNVGIGTTNPKSKLQIENLTHLLQAANGSFFTRNAYWDGSNWKYTNTGTAQNIAMPSTGDISLRYAVSGTADTNITWVEGLKIQTDGDIEIMNGNVGIGTTSPVYKLHIAGSSTIGIKYDSTAHSYIQADTTTGYQAAFSMAENGTQVANVVYDTNSNLLSLGSDETGGQLRFMTDNWTEAVRIDTSGNVGIGTTSPGARLHIKTGLNEAALVQHGQGGGLYLQTSTMGGTTSGGLFLGGGGYTSDADWGHITAGATHDMGSFTARSDAASAVFLANGNIQFRANTGLTSGNTFSFSTRMFIEGATGYVGIGTAGPGEKLTVYNGNILMNGAGLSDPVIKFRDGSSVRWTIGMDDQGLGAGNPLVFNQGDGVSDPEMVIKSENVGIGTTGPAQKLQVQGDGQVVSAIVGNTGDATIGLDVSDTTGERRAIISWEGVGGNVPLTFRSGVTWNGNRADTGNEVMRITASGNVGIGTTNPGSYKLYVNGSLYSTNLTTESLTVNNSVIAEKFLDKSDQNFGLDPAGTGMNGYSLRISGGAILAQTTGNVGIGTTNPGAKLDVQGGDIRINNIWLREYDSGTAIGFGYGSSGAQVYTGALSVGYNYGTQSPWAGLTVAGNVGIGTTNPSEKLSVAGNIWIGGIGMTGYGGIIKSGTYPFETYLHYTDDGTGYGPAWIHTNTATGNTVPTMFLQTSGDDANLRVNKAIGIGPMTVTLGSYPSIITNIWLDGSGGNSYFATGNVGIGTTSPGSYKLYVAGTAYILRRYNMQMEE
ncbi:MAG: hypothetical protein KatS3mg090_0641 [Patescibacteria group bacterium]|nr:MAG: hypothetical protein KatS3mg090_0641 [Patescibacteria group bacterium]